MPIDKVRIMWYSYNIVIRYVMVGADYNVIKSAEVTQMNNIAAVCSMEMCIIGRPALAVS